MPKIVQKGFYIFMWKQFLILLKRWYSAANIFLQINYALQRNNFDFKEYIATTILSENALNSTV